MWNKRFTFHVRSEIDAWDIIIIFGLKHCTVVLNHRLCNHSMFLSFSTRFCGFSTDVVLKFLSVKRSRSKLWFSFWKFEVSVNHSISILCCYLKFIPKIKTVLQDISVCIAKNLMSSILWYLKNVKHYMKCTKLSTI